MSGNPRNHGAVILKAFWMRLHHLLNLLRSNKGPVYYFLNMPIFFSHAPWNLHREWALPATEGTASLQNPVKDFKLQPGHQEWKINFLGKCSVDCSLWRFWEWHTSLWWKTSRDSRTQRFFTSPPHNVYPCFHQSEWCTLNALWIPPRFHQSEWGTLNPNPAVIHCKESFLTFPPAYECYPCFLSMWAHFQQEAQPGLIPWWYRWYSFGKLFTSSQLFREAL